MSKGLILLGLTACVLHVSQAVSCTTATGSTCEDTLVVTGTCSSSVCACESGYAAATTGCAVTGETVTEKPIVNAGAASGQVLNGQSLTLTCATNYSSGVTYAWKKDGVDDTSLSTGGTASVTVDSDTFSHTYACTITVSGNSITSDTFTVTGYANAAGAITAVPYVSGVPESVTSGSAGPHTISCMNLPTDGTVTVAWTIGSASASGATTDITMSSSNFGDSIKCTVTTAGTSTLATDESPALTLPSAFVTLELVEEVKVMIYPTAPVEGGYMAVKCLVRAATLDGTSFFWKYAGVPIAGQVDHTLQLNAITDSSNGNTQPYYCEVKKDTLSVNDQTANLDILSAVGQPTLSGSSNYGTGSSYTLTCTSTSESPGMEYQWKRTVSGSSEETLTDTTKTLTITATLTSTDYTCAARIGTSGNYGTASTAHTVLAVDVIAVVVSGPLSPLASTSVTYTCTVSKGDSVSVTYRWLDADNSDAAITGETSSTYSFTAGSSGTNKGIKCEATSTTSGATAVVSTSAHSTTSVATTATPAIASDIPAIGGADKVQDGGSYTLVCSSATSTGQTSAVYEWSFTPTSGTASVLGSTGSTYSISSASTSDVGDYTCKVTVGASQSSASTTFPVARHAALGLTCSAISTCSSQDMSLYTGNCINSICECMEGVTLSPRMCGTTSSGTNAVASLLLLLLATLASRLL